jgi:hypothetical protein
MPGSSSAPSVPSLPSGRRGELFLDDRGEQRTLRLTWHREVDLVVLSLWREGRCTGTFRLRVSEVPALISALQTGLEGDLPVSSDDARQP